MSARERPTTPPTPASRRASRRASDAPPAAHTPNGHRATGAARSNGTTSRAPRAAAKRAARPAATASATEASATEALTRLRVAMCERYRPLVAQGIAPIRVMARMVAEAQAAAERQGLPNASIAEGIVNRTIGDVNLRQVSATDDGAAFATLADDMGIALPGEKIGGTTATGATYRWIHEQMLEVERELLARGWDLRMYDLPATGNPLLRELLADYERERFGITLDPANIYLSLGSLDGLDKFWRGYSFTLRQRGINAAAVVFPAPSFNVPEWQARSLGLRLHRLVTRAEDHFKVTPAMLGAALEEAPDIRAFYLTVSNNPTAFAYSYDELRALFDVLRDRDTIVVADLAYVGTAELADDRRRMAAFVDSGILPRTVLAHSFSKTHTLTGDRCGWVGFSDPELAAAVGVAWANTIATLPADWQLRYTAMVRLFRQRPELEQRIRALYRHRRAALVRQLHHLDETHHLFAQVNLDDGGTVYNWSQLRPGADVFALFQATGIAGVPGSAFGYSDDYVRLSIGCVPVPAG
ncbi:MAG TPA: pyridoxal phosphate-dependent aminotransferase [Ktedonobacterales bacterium]